MEPGCSPRKDQPDRECSRICRNSLMAHSVSFSLEKPSGVTLVIIKCTIPGGREQIPILIKRISPPPLLAPFYSCQFKFFVWGRKKNKKYYKQMLMMEKKHIFFEGGEKMPLEAFYAERCRGAQYIKENIIHPG